MNNNRNNNRRRGRGQNRQQGGGQQLNRIDSRARGNAPQLLEKYRKLAHDAHLNGDRVQAEYYLQFADHYFRVLADQRLRQEEQRRPRDERFGEGGYDEGDDGEFGAENDIPGFDQPYRREEREPREPREAREPRRDESGREPGRDNGREGGRDERREPRNRDNGRDTAREERAPRQERFDEPRQSDEAAPEPAPAPEPASAFEPAGGNPFTRDNRAARGGLRPRREREAPRNLEGEPGGEESAGLDPALLPPAISEAREAVAEAGEEAPAPRRRGRPRKAAPDEGGGSLETVSG